MTHATEYFFPFFYSFYIFRCFFSFFLLAILSIIRDLRVKVTWYLEINFGTIDDKSGKSNTK